MLQNLSFHHIGYAVKDIDATAQFYLNAGWRKSDTTIDSIQNTYIAFLYKVGNPTIELVAPVDKQAPICNILKRSGVGTYHVCYSVPDIEKAVVELRAQRFMPLFEPVEAAAIDNHRICYLMHPQVGLIELVEE